MNRVQLTIGLIAITMLTSLACSVLPFISTGEAQSGDVLFWDDFSNPGSGWDVLNDAGSLVAYQDGGLRFFIDQPHYDYWSRPGKRFEDVRLAVEAVNLGDVHDNNFGLLCGFRNAENYYSFLISSDGYAGIVKVKDGEAQIISEVMMAYTEVIRKGETANFIGADCTTEKLVMHVNGFRLFEISDADYHGGEIGLIAGSYQTAGVDILFKNFVASKP